AHRRPPRLRDGTPRARAREPQRPRPAAARLPAALLASDPAGADRRGPRNRRLVFFCGPSSRPRPPGARPAAARDRPRAGPRAGRESLNVRGAFLHLATDLAAFAGTALAGGLILLTGWNRFDPLAGLAVAALMFWSSASLLRDSGRIFLEAAPAEIDPDEVAAELAAQPDVV